MIYRVLIDDISAGEDCRDFSDCRDALTAYRNARRKRSTFSVRIDEYDENTHEHIGVVEQWEMGE